MTKNLSRREAAQAFTTIRAKAKRQALLDQIKAQVTAFRAGSKKRAWATLVKAVEDGDSEMVKAIATDRKAIRTLSTKRREDAKPKAAKQPSKTKAKAATKAKAKAPAKPKADDSELKRFNDLLAQCDPEQRAAMAEAFLTFGA